MSSGSDSFGLWRAVSKQVDLQVEQYDGKAREGELVVDSNPGPNQYKVYIGTAGGNLVPVSGGGGNAVYADTANVANVANAVAGPNVVGPVLDANHANVADVANSVAGANVVGTVPSAIVAATANAVAGANVSGQVSDSAHADTADDLGAAGAANVRVGGGTLGQVLKSDGAGGMVWATDDSAPAPPDTSIQFNKGGAFDGDATFTFDSSIGLMTAPNIAVTGESNLGPVANVKITGGTSGQVLTTDGSGGLSWATAGGTPWQIANGTSDLSFATLNGALTGNLSGNPAFFIDGAANWNISIGINAGSPTQAYGAIAMGPSAGNTNQGTQAIAIGDEAGAKTQGESAIAIGVAAGSGYSGPQGANAIAIGRFAGADGQAANAISIGSDAGKTNQGGNAIAIGNIAAQTGQGAKSVSIGYSAGKISQGANSIAIGANAGINSQAANSIILNATGANLDAATAGSLVIAPVRADATNTAQALYYNTTTKEVTYNAVAEPWRISNGTSNVSLATSGGPITGFSSGKAVMTVDASANLNIALGSNAGLLSQDYAAIAIGVTAGRDTQGVQAIAIGEEAGWKNQGTGAIAIGTAAGVGATVGQGGNAIAIGRNAGYEGQGANSVAIGSYAGQTNQAGNSIVINATGAALDNTTADSIKIAPVRNDLTNTANVLYYNSTTKEVTYAPAGGGGGTPAGANTEVQFNDAGAFGAQSTFTFDKSTDTVTVKDFNVTGNVVSALIPDANITYDLGTSTQRWKDLWLSNTSIHLGDQVISANTSHVLLNDMGIGNIVATGNVQAVSFTGSLANGSTSVNIAAVDGNIDFAVGGISQWRMSDDGTFIILGTEGNIVGDSTQTLTMRSGLLNIGTVDNTADAGNVGLFSILGGAGGDGASGSGEGGDIALIAGRSGNAATGAAAEGGSIQLTTGAGGNGDTGGFAGSIELISNNGGDAAVDTGGRGGNLNITLGDGGTGITTGGVGGEVNLMAGDGGNSDAGTAGMGGAITLAGGNGGSTTSGSTARGGNISITAGSSGTNASGLFQSQGGFLTILSGNGAPSGDVYLGSANSITPPSGSGGWTGSVTVAAGNAADSNDSGAGRGGNLNLRAGSGGNSISGGAGQRGGTVNLSAGNGGYGEDGARGGNLIFTAGNAGYSTNDDGYDGGRVSITAGNGSHSTSGGYSGAGGSVTITSGSSQTVDGQSPGAENAGIITLQGGVGSPGGRINIYGGQGIQSDGVTSPGAGGSVWITAGSAGVNALSGPGAGGSVNITAGTSTGPTGIGGAINLRPAQGPDSWGNVRIDIDNPSGVIENAWRFSKDTTTYLDQSRRLHFPQWRNSAQSISGAITTVSALPIANDNQAIPGTLNCYTASSAQVWAVKLLVYVSHDTYTAGSEITEIMEYFIARNNGGTLQVQQNSYLASDPTWTVGSGLRSSVSASLDVNGVIVATVNAITGNNIVVNYTATEFLLGTV